MTPLNVVREGARRLHSCSVCGAWGEWTNEWSWFGSWRDFDEHPARLIVTCSAVCKYDAKAAGATS